MPGKEKEMMKEKDRTVCLLAIGEDFNSSAIEQLKKIADDNNFEFEKIIIDPYDSGLQEQLEKLADKSSTVFWMILNGQITSDQLGIASFLKGRHFQRTFAWQLIQGYDIALIAKVVLEKTYFSLEEIEQNFFEDISRTVSGRTGAKILSKAMGGFA